MKRAIDEASINEVEHEFMSTQRAFLEKKEAVMIGGGAIGCRTALHLAQRGCRDVVFLEKDKIASGASSKAAGQLVHGGITDAATRSDVTAHWVS